jgi:hypothetical protein
MTIQRVLRLTHGLQARNAVGQTRAAAAGADAARRLPIAGTVDGLVPADGEHGSQWPSAAGPPVGCGPEAGEPYGNAGAWAGAEPIRNAGRPAAGGPIRAEGVVAGGGPDQATGAAVGSGPNRAAEGLVRGNAGGTGAAGHDGVNRQCPGHWAPTASVDALTSFTYHLPL